MSDLMSLITALVLVLVAGVLVAAETALARVSRVSIEQLKKKAAVRPANYSACLMIVLNM